MAVACSMPVAVSMILGSEDSDRVKALHPAHPRHMGASEPQGRDAGAPMGSAEDYSAAAFGAGASAAASAAAAGAGGDLPANAPSPDPPTTTATSSGSPPAAPPTSTALTPPAQGRPHAAASAPLLARYQSATALDELSASARCARFGSDASIGGISDGGQCASVGGGGGGTLSLMHHQRAASSPGALRAAGGSGDSSPLFDHLVGATGAGAGCGGLRLFPPSPLDAGAASVGTTPHQVHPFLDPLLLHHHQATTSDQQHLRFPLDCSPHAALQHLMHQQATAATAAAAAAPLLLSPQRGTPTQDPYCKPNNHLYKVGGGHASGAAGAMPVGRTGGGSATPTPPAD